MPIRTVRRIGLRHRFGTIDVGSGTIRLRGTDHVDPPHVTTNHCHDVALVGTSAPPRIPLGEMSPLSLQKELDESFSPVVRRCASSNFLPLIFCTSCPQKNRCPNRYRRPLHCSRLRLALLAIRVPFATSP